MKKIGTVTIGQAPRIDVIPDMAAILGKDVEIVEAGALDGLSKTEIAGMAPERGDYVLVTRLADGSSVQVAEKHITPRIIEKINRHFDKGLPLVLLLCTGEFPGFKEGGLLIRPQRLLFNVVSAIGGNVKLGVLVPSPDQVEQARAQWGALGGDLRICPASPYVDGLKAAEGAAEELRAWGVQLTVLDCIGYTMEMQERVRTITGKPVVLGRGVAARMVKELIG
jgi:protein AroM